MKSFLKRIPGVGRLILWRSQLKIFARQIAFRMKGGTRFEHRYYSEPLLDALRDRPTHSDISDHLGLIFSLATQARPSLIVELGTRAGESTRSLLAAASLSGATLLSVDRDELGDLDIPYREHWRFVQADDVEFGSSGFADWCQNEGLQSVVDVLLIDTSHEYEHTLKEIRAWERWLANDGVMIFHDTNMGGGVYAHTDGSVFAAGWDNSRGVIMAIEKFLGRQYDERNFFYDLAKSYLVVHIPYCNGLTVLHKINKNDDTH